MKGHAAFEFKKGNYAYSFDSGGTTTTTHFTEHFYILDAASLWQVNFGKKVKFFFV